MKLIKFEQENSSWVWINPSKVNAVMKNTTERDGNYTDIILNDGRKITVANQVEDVVNRIDIWLN